MRRPIAALLLSAVTALPFGGALTPRSAHAQPALPAARDGCANQWMFNGLWRVRVIKVDPLMDGGRQSGWLVTEQWRNGTDRKLAPFDTFAKEQVLALANGSTIEATATTPGSLSAQDLGFHGFPPAAQYTHLQKFLSTGPLDPAVKPAAVFIPFDPAREARERKDLPQYSKTPAAYKIGFECTPSAAQTAEGGAYELSAKDACLDQWVANGLVKFRATQVAPEMVNGAQLGWQVSQEWINASSSKLGLANIWLDEQQLVLANDDTVGSSNATVTTLQNQQLGNRPPLNPGAMVAHVQNFRYDRPAFDPSNKPTKLLIVFNTGAYRYFNQKPFPGNPPNFRIHFDCRK